MADETFRDDLESEEARIIAEAEALAASVALEDASADTTEATAADGDENTTDVAGVAGDDDEIDDPELEAMKQKVKEMEEEAKKLQEMQDQVEKQMAVAAPTEPKEDIDARSVYVGNVDYGATPEELQIHFGSCGAINRITIMCDTYTGQPKGYAYIEFSDKSAVDNAQVLDESLFRGRQIKVVPKRTNVPGLKMRGGRRARRGGAPGYSPYYNARGGGGGRGGGGRGRFTGYGNRRASFQ
ncbi:hypothetical protein SARC_02389 [Sphaeroforma arctica JP610]|uniref:RRM domain-containing protein n=1 Tax=Sphaeroforma arctica JP610 TaxID=667725 RepID=A0A0L0G953_9EUKA|nr:hypothetical protein SARC_02389 [Sphaeroforma arctica JP610]KNC85439.1 hypothetical protein SARC_02389 [Sphaeroforma arctica JP610]|eukprot:XP_014159341.1 hypothetical protein SARC_02389 [Sphaeroforma arctica JP610]